MSRARRHSVASTNGLAMLRSLVGNLDLAVALRRLRGDKVVAGILVCMLASAVGVHAALGELAYRLVFKALPFPASDRLSVVWLSSADRGATVYELSQAGVSQWRDRASHVRLALMSAMSWAASVEHGAAPYRIKYRAVSADFFDVLGVGPIVGRSFAAGDDVVGSQPVVVIGERFWKQRLSNDPQVVNRTLSLRGPWGLTTYTIIGVVPSHSQFPKDADLWIPATAQLHRLSAADANLGDPTRLGVFYSLARFDGDVPLPAARRALAETIQAIERGPDERQRVPVITPLREYAIGPITAVIAPMSVTVLLLTLVVSLNVASAIRTRAVLRTEERATRIALGATPWRSMRPAVLEGAIIVLAGWGGGLIVALWCKRVLTHRVLEETLVQSAPYPAGVTLLVTSAVIVVVLILAAMSARVGANVLPVDLSRRVRGVSQSRQRPLASKLLVPHIAIAYIMVALGAAQTVGLLRLWQIDVGFEPARVLTTDFIVQEDLPNPVRRALLTEGLDRIRAIKGVAAVAAVYQRPFENGPIGMDTHFLTDKQPLSPETFRQSPLANWESVTEEYFTAMGIRLRRGRTFDARDTENSQRVVVVSENFASYAWPDSDAIGRRLIAFGAGLDPRTSKPNWQTVVGVVDTVHYRGLTDATFNIYQPYTQAPELPKQLIVRTDNEPLTLSTDVRRVVESMSGVTLDRVTTMEAVVGNVLASRRLLTAVALVFGLLTLLAASAGAAAVALEVSHSRQEELGTRLALGATRPGLIKLLLRETSTTAIIGSLAGAVVLFIGFRIAGYHPSTLGIDRPSVPLVGFFIVVGAVMLASAVPAFGFLRNEPSILLRRRT